MEPCYVGFAAIRPGGFGYLPLANTPKRILGYKKRRSNERLFGNTEDRNRTDMELPPPDFESGASTSSATPANAYILHDFFDSVNPYLEIFAIKSIQYFGVSAFNIDAPGQATGRQNAGIPIERAG